MSDTQKLDKKELKSPDAFQAAGTEAQSWIQKHEKTVVMGVAGAMVLGFGVGLVNWVGKRSDDKSARKLGAAIQPLERGVEGVDVLPPPQPGTTPKPLFKSQSEKDQAVESSLETFRKENGGSRAASVAGLPEAQVELRLGKYAEALEGFDAFLKATQVDDPLRAAALEGRGYAFEGQGQLDKAHEAFGQLAKENASPFLEGMGPYHQARILLAQGKKQEAAQGFAEVASKFPKTAAARMAQDRVSALIAQGVTPPAVAGGADAGT